MLSCAGAKSIRKNGVTSPPANRFRMALSKSFNGRMRDELLNESVFPDLTQARQMIASWTADYNTRRPHSSFGYSIRRVFDQRSRCPPGLLRLPR